MTHVGCAIIAAEALARTASASHMPKSDFMYQDHRHDGKGCDQCKFFAPGAPPSDVGTCSVVEGTVSRDGWCTAFTPKSAA